MDTDKSWNNADLRGVNCDRCLDRAQPCPAEKAGQVLLRLQLRALRHARRMPPAEINRAGRQMQSDLRLPARGYHAQNSAYDVAFKLGKL